MLVFVKRARAVLFCARPGVDIYTEKNDLLKITIIHSIVEIYLQYKKIAMFL